MWIAPTDTSSNSVQQQKLFKWSKRTGNTPPHAKLSEAFKGNKLGVSSQKNLLVGSITGNNNVNVRSFILNSLNHGRGSLIPLTDRVSVWVAEDLVFTSTVPPSPSFPWITLTIRPKCQFPLGRFWSTTSTRSPTCAFRRGLYHF